MIGKKLTRGGIQNGGVPGIEGIQSLGRNRPNLIRVGIQLAAPQIGLKAQLRLILRAGGKYDERGFDVRLRLQLT